MGSLADFKEGTLASQESVKKENYLIRQETFALTAATNKTYNVATLLGAEKVGDYDLKSIQVELLVIDTEPGSPTNGYYVAADNVAHIGFKITGEVLVRNAHTATLDFMIRIRVTKKSDK